MHLLLLSVENEKEKNGTVFSVESMENLLKDSIQATTKLVKMSLDLILPSLHMNYLLNERPRERLQFSLDGMVCSALISYFYSMSCCFRF